jgi:hypothetical protein
MPSFGVDDGGWGSIASGFADALSPDPAKRAHMMVLSEQYKKLKAQRDAVAQAIGAYDASTQADPNFEMSPGVSGAGPEGIPLAPQEIASVEARRNLARKSYAATASLAHSAEDFAKGVPRMMGQNTILPGIPTDKATRDIAQTQLSGSIPSYDEAKTAPHNVVELDESGKPVPGTQRVVRNLEGLPQPAAGRRYALTGPAEMSPKGFGDADTRLRFLGEAVADLDAKGPEAMTQPRLREAETVLNEHFPKTQKFEADARGNKVLLGFEEKAIPRQFTPLVRLINEKLYGQQPSAPAPVEPGAPAVPFPQAMPGALSTADALAGAVSSPAPTPGAAGAPPVTPPVPPGAVPQAGAAPGGVTVTAIPGMGGGPATHESALLTSRVEQARDARLHLQAKMGYDERTGNLPVKLKIPGAMALDAAASGLGTTNTGQQWLNRLAPGAMEYYAEGMRWVEPVLRNASGAAIQPAENSRYFQMFIPGPGDSRAEVLRKLDAMKLWEQSTARASTANEALTTMETLAGGDKETIRLAREIRAIALRAGTLNKPLEQPSAVTQPQAGPTAPVQRRAAFDHGAVDALLESP